MLRKRKIRTNTKLVLKNKKKKTKNFKKKPRRGGMPARFKKNTSTKNLKKKTLLK